MQSNLFFPLKGYVTIEVRGPRVAAFLNLAASQRLTLWDIRVREPERVELNLLLKDFFLLRPLLRQTKSRVRVVKRHGVPFFLDKLGKRKFFALGLIMFIVGLYLMSSIVWQVKVEGNEKLTTAEILEAAKTQGIRPFQWKFRLKDADTLSKELHSRLPSTSWVGVELHGGQMIIKVVESIQPELTPLLSPRHLVASKNALVTDIRTQKGKPMVKPNTYVRKGDVLISGIIGDDLNQQIVVATGTVMGLVWYTSKIEIPLLHTLTAYTGEATNRFYLVFGSRALQLTGYGKQPFTQFETITERKTLHWRDYILPIGWMNEKVMQVTRVEQMLDFQDAKTLGMERARAEILAGASKEATVTAEKVLQEKSENGKVYLEMHFEVKEPITEELPIVQVQAIAGIDTEAT